MAINSCRSLLRRKSWIKKSKAILTSSMVKTEIYELSQLFSNLSRALVHFQNNSYSGLQPNWPLWAKSRIQRNDLHKQMEDRIWTEGPAVDSWQPSSAALTEKKDWTLVWNVYQDQQLHQGKHWTAQNHQFSHIHGWTISHNAWIKPCPLNLKKM